MQILRFVRRWTNIQSADPPMKHFNHWPRLPVKRISQFLWKLLRGRYGNIRLYLMDLNCIGYLLVIGVLLLVFNRRVVNWNFLSFQHLVLVFVILELIRFAKKNPNLKFVRFLRIFYPLMIISYGWWEIGHLVRMFFATFWASDFVASLDSQIFGVHPTIWIQNFYSPWLDEVFNVFYCTYYFLPPLVPIFFFIKGKQQETTAAFSMVTTTYVMNFFLFLVFPAVGPQMISWLEDMRIQKPGGYWAAQFTQLMQANGGNVGGAFPSSHISGATIWTLAAMRYFPRLGRPLLVVLPGIALSTVYLGYHHAVDPITGLLLGLISFKISLFFLARRGEDPLKPAQYRAQELSRETPAYTTKRGASL